ncbi:MAG: hypothetical protein E7604_12800 [Ruminococcaceae bacterium]|nr:hypothetical protein [Oscillospiraceae bacterium]
MKKHTGTIIMIVIIAIAAVITILSTFTVVPSGYVGVKVTMGQVSDEVLNPGMYLHIPFVQSITKVMTKQVDQVYGDTVWGESSEQTAVYMADITVTYKLNPGMASYVVKNVANYSEDLVNVTLVSSALKAAARTLETTQVTNRSFIETAAVTSLQNAVNNKYGTDVVTVLNVNINDMDFEESYQNAIAERQLAEQAYQRQVIENKTAIEKAEADKQVAITNAEAQAEADRIAAEAQAEIVRIAAEAQAEANRKLSESITDQLVEYQKIEAWDGKLPVVQGSDNAFVDVSSIAGQ